MDVSQRLAVLTGSPVFAALPTDALGFLAEIVRVEEFAKDATVCVVDEPADAVYVVASGRLAVTLRGASTAVRTLGPGDVLGEYGMFGAAVRTASVRAEDRSVLLSVDYERFRSYLCEFPEAMWVLFGTAVERLVAAERRAVAD